jgi:mRNA interferase RelE/StbE
MAWRVEFHPAAARELDKLDPQSARRLLRFLSERVAASPDPRRMGSSLRGSRLGEFWKYRVGDFRLICRIEDAELLVLVLRAAHRREVYRRGLP